MDDTSPSSTPAGTGPAGRAEGGSKAAIHRAAERLFAERGYAGASVRDIAGLAGVNPALVIRHFGSKEALFVSAMRFEDGFRELLTGPTESIGEAIVRRLLDQRPGEYRAHYTAMLRAGDMEEVRAYILEANAQITVGPLLERLRGPDARTRAVLVSAQIAGLLNLLWILEAPELLAAPAATIVERYGRAIQSLVDP